jgi:nitrite reductase/ring-hydroxylating ferredoxin subunit
MLPRAKRPIPVPTPADATAAREDVPGPSVTQVMCDGSALVRTSVGAVALFAVADKVFAIDDACIRCGTSLCAGRLHRMVVSCAGCGWRYDIATGQVKNVPALRAHVYDVSIVEGCIRLSSTPAAWRHL